MKKSVLISNSQNLYILAQLYINHPTLGMKILKYLFFLILLLFIGSAIYFGTKDGTYEIQETTFIPVHPELVFNKVNNLNSWETWSPWKKENPDDIFNAAEKSTGEGALVSWDVYEKGNIETLKVIPITQIDQELTQTSSGSERTSNVKWIFNDAPNGTDVTWTIKGEYSLMDKVRMAIKKTNLDKELYSRMQTALSDLKEEIEEDTRHYSIHVDGITHYGGGYYMYMTAAAKKTEVQNQMESMMKQVSDFMEKNHVSQAGKPFVIYHEMDEETGTVIFSTCFPTRERVITPEESNVVSGFMEPVAAIKTTLKGHYKNISEAYEKAKKYVDNNEYLMDDHRKIFEVYATNPAEIHNPADWVTEIYIPVISQEITEEIGTPRTRKESVLEMEREE